MLYVCHMQISHFNHSLPCLTALREAQLRADINPPLKLVQDVATRWNSQLSMAQRLIKLRAPIMQVMHNPSIMPEDESTKLSLSPKQWGVSIININYTIANLPSCLK